MVIIAGLGELAKKERKKEKKERKKERKKESTLHWGPAGCYRRLSHLRTFPNIDVKMGKTFACLQSAETSYVLQELTMDGKAQ
ncbi:Hypothetical predicted protein [Podarcis lilfordi]|uniref:Uncharacterized protein n=1 Tax=Podarcis lilfordi TaxID=74358 RepID=A0AA35KLH3_9SAUR|nr:Hypothetical predicted protein [Podarcis lilfordi]